MRLIDHIGVDLTGRAHLSQATAQSDAWFLTQAYGSSRAAARHLGVPETTFRGWRKGTPPRGGARDMLRQEAREAAIDQHTHFDDAYDGDHELVIRGVFTVSSDERERTIHPGRTILRKEMRPILDLWRAGDDDAAEEKLIKLLKKRYVEDMVFDQVYWARFMPPGEQRG